MPQATFSVYRKIEASPSVAVHGSVFTKPHIVDLMLDLAGYRPGEGSLLDPGCGEGAFIVAAASRLVRSIDKPSFDSLAPRLFGIDKDRAAASACRSRIRSELERENIPATLAKKLAEHWIMEGDFLDYDFADRRFDFVVGNPPYVRQEAIPKAKLARYRGEFSCFFDRADLYVAFFERGLRLLDEHGRLAFICPDRFTRNNYGRKLRALISSEYSVECVLDLAQASPFEQDVASYPGVFVVRRGRQAKSIDFFRMTTAAPAECDDVRQKKSTERVDYHRYDEWFSGEQQWSLESPAHLTLLRRLERENIALGNAASGVRVGIGVATGADELFIVDRDSQFVEPELLMPLVTTRDIATGTVQWRGQCVINPFVGETNELIDLDKFPKARAYLAERRSTIEKRNVAQRDRRKWFRTIDRIYPSLQTTPKLLIPDIKAESHIVLEVGEYYPHHNLYFVASDAWNLRALRAILRSSLGKFFVSMYGVKMRGDFLRFQAQYLRRICIPQLLFANKRLIERLADLDESADASACDEIVASLYQLSDDELSLIQSLASPRRIVSE